MDIANLDLRKNAEAGLDLVINHPLTGDETDIIISVVGSDSRQYRQAYAEEIRRAYTEKPSHDESDARVYSQCITGWSGIEENGKEVEFSPEAALNIFSKYQWICDQVGLAVDARANFTKPPKKS